MIPSRVDRALGLLFYAATVVTGGMYSWSTWPPRWGNRAEAEYGLIFIWAVAVTLFGLLGVLATIRRYAGADISAMIGVASATGVLAASVFVGGHDPAWAFGYASLSLVLLRYVVRWSAPTPYDEIRQILSEEPDDHGPT